jgi:hypothetical protein
MRITLTGIVSKAGDRLLLAAEDLKPGSPKFELVQASGHNEKEKNTGSAAFTAAGASAGKTVEVEAFWAPANSKKGADALPTLAVIRVAVTKPDAPKEETGK